MCDTLSHLLTWSARARCESVRCVCVKSLLLARVRAHTDKVYQFNWIVWLVCAAFRATATRGARPHRETAVVVVIQSAAEAAHAFWGRTRVDRSVGMRRPRDVCVIRWVEWMSGFGHTRTQLQTRRCKHGDGWSEWCTAFERVRVCPSGINPDYGTFWREQMRHN